MEEQGIRLYLDGKPSSPKSIARACHLAEKTGVYMRDYIGNDRGEIARVEFDYIPLSDTR